MLPVIGGAGAYSSRKGLAPWRGQCHHPRVGVPPLRPAGLTSGAALPTKKSQQNARYDGDIPLLFDKEMSIREMKEHFTSSLMRLTGAVKLCAKNL